MTGNYNYEIGSMTGILGQLKWESLKKRRTDNRLILLYKGLKGKASVPTDDLIPKTRRCRNQHSMAFQIPIANTDVYKGRFFPQTIRDWNAQSYDPICPKTLCSLSPTPMMLHIKFDQDWPTGFRDIQVQKCEIFVTQGQVTPK